MKTQVTGYVHKAIIQGKKAHSPEHILMDGNQSRILKMLVVCTKLLNARLCNNDVYFLLFFFNLGNSEPR